MANQPNQQQTYWRPILKLLEIVYIQKFEACPFMRPDFVAPRPGHDHGEPRNQPRQPAREPTADEISRCTAMGFADYMAQNALRMNNLNVERAIETLLSDEAGIAVFIEQENAAKRQKEEEKRKQKEFEEKHGS